MKSQRVATILLTGVLLIASSARSAMATTIGFEGLISETNASFTTLAISNSYLGYKWSASPVLPGDSGPNDWGAVDCVVTTCFDDQPLTAHSGSGYGWTFSGPQSLYIDFGAPTHVGGGWFAGQFLFGPNGFFFGANSRTMQLFGYDASNNLIASSGVLDLVDSQWQFLGANFSDVYRLELRSDRDVSWFAVDDLDVTPAPEPGTLVLIGTGLLAGVRRLTRRR